MKQMNNTLELPMMCNLGGDKKERFPVSLHISDVHWRTSVPEYRKESGSFHRVIAKKLQTVFDYNRKNGINPLPIFVSGDLFDGTRDFMQYYSLSSFLHEQDWKQTHIYCVRGQHDMYHHNPNDNATAFNALVREKLIRRLHKPFVLIADNKRFAYYGCSWGESVPVPESTDDTNILILHKTLWYNKPVFPGQVEGNVKIESVKLAELGYNFVFSGDNHKAFDVTYNGVCFHNLGAFTRNSIDLANQQPRFSVLFSDRSVESINVGEHNVFEIDRSEADKFHEGAKDEFSKALAGGFCHGDTFRGSLEATVQSGKCGEVEFTIEQIALLKDIINSL